MYDFPGSSSMSTLSSALEVGLLDPRGSINEGVIVWFISFFGAVHWILYWRGLSVTLSGFAFVTSPIFIIMPWCTPQKFSTPLSGAPQKCFKSGPAHANAGPGPSVPRKGKAAVLQKRLQRDACPQRINSETLNKLKLLLQNFSFLNCFKATYNISRKNFVFCKVRRSVSWRSHGPFARVQCLQQIFPRSAQKCMHGFVLSCIALTWLGNGAFSFGPTLGFTVMIGITL